MKASENKLKSDTYSNLDIAKIIASLLIITIHCSPFLSLNSDFDFLFVSTVSRIAVPFFFACSGFLLFRGLADENGKIVCNKQNIRKLIKYIKRLVILYVVWSAVYLLWQIPQWYSIGWLSPGAFVDYIIAFFRDGSYYHMWYILSLIYAVPFGYLLVSFFSKKVVFAISLVLYLLGILTYSYSWLELPFMPVLNQISSATGVLWVAITRAFPLMFFGYFTAASETVFSLKAKLILLFVSFLGLVAEVILLMNYTSNEASFSYLIFTIPVEILLFSILVKGKQISVSKAKSKIFRNTSAIVYCLHPMIINLLSLIPVYEDFSSLVKYSAVTIISFAIAVIIVKISSLKKLRLLKYLY